MSLLPAGRSTGGPQDRRRLLPAEAIVLFYLLVGSLWILARGPMVDTVTVITSAPRGMVDLLHGVLFVVAAALLLEVTLRRRSGRLERGAADAEQDAARLAESEARNHLQATALSGTANAVLVTGLDGTIEWVNAAFE